QQLRFAFRVVGVRVDAFDRAHGHALRFVEMADALGAQRRIDDVDRFALRDRPVRAHRLADVAVDAELVDLQGHARIVSAGRRGTVPPPEKAVRIRAGSASAGGRSPGPTRPASPGRGPCTAPLRSRYRGRARRRARPGTYLASTNT